MTNETLETLELGQAEALIGLGLPFWQEEMLDKFESTAVPYVEFD